MSDQPVDLAGRFMDDYFAECEEHLIAVRRSLLALEGFIGQPVPPAAIVEELFRSFHSLKGISAMVDLRDAERLAHEMESCLRAIRQREIALAQPTLDALVDGVHVLEQVIVARRTKGDAPSIAEPIDRLAESSRTTRPAAAAATDPLPPGGAGQLWRVTFTPSPALVARGIKVDTIRARVLEVGSIQSVAPRVVDGGIAFDFQVVTANGDPFAAWRDDGVQAELITDAAAASAATSSSATAPGDRPSKRPLDSPLAQANFVRVDLARLDDLMRLVSDLVVSRARLEDALQRIERFTPAPEWRTLQEHSENIEHHLRDLREGVMRVRLVPVGEMFRRVPFVVRDLARDNDKRIQLDLAGQTTEIDKFLVERMMDPMLHLVRNAVSHGIESPEQRIANVGSPGTELEFAL